ncbi:MAG: undecaprenyl-diphosphate phosphatase [Firmicutes bacterium]|nr:undecaprenyl-diphosphate phosphatase [Bacillota bacterium]
MTIIVAIILGLVQGLTEFLPVSSSGHLILAQHIFGLDGDLLLFNIVLHIATLCAVLLVFWRKIWAMLKNPLQPKVYALLLATIITVTFVLLFRDFIERTFTASILPITFMITAIVLFATTFIKRNEGEVKMRSAAATGLAQGLAVIPGFSRSGFTIATAMATGSGREAAAEFSFLMSIPIIIGALLFEVTGDGPITMGVDGLQLVLAFIVALVAGVFSIKFMLRIVRRIRLWYFSIYLIALAIATLFILN